MRHFEPSAHRTQPRPRSHTVERTLRRANPYRASSYTIDSYTPSPTREKPLPPRTLLLLDSVDQATANHCRRVAWYASGFAERLGLTAVDVDFIRLGALLHHAGKAAERSAFLTAPSSHPDRSGSPGTRDRVPFAGNASASDRAATEMALPMAVQYVVRHHRERWDGAGSPDGLVGREIPLGARIVSIVDAFDTRVMPRSRRSGHSTLQALKSMEEEGGARFDPDLLESFFSLMVHGTRHPGPAAA